MTFLELYRGVISALLGALFFGIGTVVFRMCSEEIDVRVMNFLRCIIGFLSFVVVVILVGDLPRLLSLSRYLTILLGLSVFFNVIIGDTIYFLAQTYIGVSRAFPITNLRPIFTISLAYLFLKELITENIVVGALLVMFGVYIVAKPQNNKMKVFDRRKQQIGLVFAFATALCWTFGVLTVRAAFSEAIHLNSITANAVRYGLAIPFLGLMSTGKGSGPIRKIKNYNWRTIQLIVLGTFLTTTFGTYFWGEAIRFIGASKAATIDSTAPLFGTIAALIILEEKVSWKTIFGTVLTIIGIWLVV